MKLIRGNDVSIGKSPLELVKERKLSEKDMKKSVLEYGASHTLNEIIDEFSLSSTTISKVISPKIRKGEINAKNLISKQLFNEIEEFILNGGTNSIKKMRENSNYDEGAIRIVKSFLEGKNSWD